jgi:TonB family protein
MPAVRISLPLALALSLGVHAGLLALGWSKTPPPPAVPEPLQLVIAPVQEPPPRFAPPPTHAARLRPAIPTPPVAAEPERLPLPDSAPSAPEKQPATMAAPPSPTAEEWQLASTYTLKNSKRYRYNWGQQVRSMMGTTVEGVKSGLVRFRVEIAPDGTLARAEVLWSTSDVVEQLALQAIRAMPPLPPTPTGKPLVFEKTIAFLPFETGWPPIYKNDCLPDPPSYGNRFAWDGSSPQRTAQAQAEDAAPADSADPPAECPDAGPDSIEAEEKDMERQFKEWGSLGE